MKKCLGFSAWFAAAACSAVAATTPGLQDVMLAWDPSPGVDVVGYRVYYGTGSFSYTNRVEVTNSFVTGHSTNVVVPNLLPGGTYFFAATAFDSFNQESDFSNEVSFDTPVDPTPAPTITLQAGVMNLNTPGSVTFITRVDVPGHFIKGIDVVANGESVRQYSPGGTVRGSFAYKVVWTNIASGDYELKARVLYDFDGVAESDSISFGVAGSSPEAPVEPSSSTVAKTRLTLRSEMPADNGAHQTSGAGEIESVLTRWVTSGTSYSAGLPPLLHGLVTSDTSTSFELARHIVRRYWSRFPETTRQALEVLPSTTERDELFRLGEELAGSAESFRNVIRYHPDLERVLMVDVVRQWYLLEPARMVVWAAALPESPARLQILQAMGIEPGAPSGAPL